jgi:biotin synthase-related radical SAM superfamily protein
MNNKQLSKIVQDAAKEKGIEGVMALTKVSPLSYERTRKVWDGVKEAKISDYIDVMKTLGRELKFVSKGDK